MERDSTCAYTEGISAELRRVLREALVQWKTCREPDS